MAITFFGVATTPADNSAQAGPTVTLTPPASMVDGDLVFVTVRYRDSAATIADTPSNTGGQTWNPTTQYNTTNIRARVFWCRFNGTWSANPAFTVTSGTNNMDAQMLVFRPTSAAYTWSIESGPNGATYSAPSSPFTVNITGRNTTAPSTVSIAAWHSVDDNSWGTLSGTGWSKTSLGAQYRNNSTQDNSSSFAYNIKTSAGATNDVSQVQSALGGDAGSTALFTFAETLVSTAPTGVAATTAAGSLAIANPATGISGVEASSAAGTITIPEAAGSNATATPSGVAATAALGVLALFLSPIVVPTGAGVGATAATLAPNITVVPVGVSATASAGTATGIGVAGGVVPLGGVVSNTAAGSLGSAITVVGIAGAQATSAVGSIAVEGAGIQHGAGQPSTVFATAQVGGLAVLTLVPLQGASVACVAEDMSASLVLEEVDSNQGTASAGSVTPAIAVPIGGVSSTPAVGSVATVATVVLVPTGAQAAAIVGNLAGVTAGTGAAVPSGVAASAQVGTLVTNWTGLVLIAGVEATAAANDVDVEAGDSTGVEVFPSGVEATVQLGVLSTGEARAAPTGIFAQALAGSISVSSAIAQPLDRPDSITIVPVLEAEVSIEPVLTAELVRLTPQT